MFVCLCVCVSFFLAFFFINALEVSEVSEEEMKGRKSTSPLYVERTRDVSASDLIIDQISNKPSTKKK